MSASKPAEAEAPKPSLGAVLAQAGKKTFRGGVPGFCAMIIQVAALMWMRTLVNYQYARGGSFGEAFSTLYGEGGIGRFYNGFWAAVIVGPLSRFGDTAANAGILALCDGVLPVGVSTMLASAGAAVWRIATQPVQNVKTLMQVEGGGAGLKLMASRVNTAGVGALWEGAFGTMGATWLGHYPWFATNNMLRSAVPPMGPDGSAAQLARDAGIGFCSSVVSDCVSNGIRVITTAKQTSAVSTGYVAVMQSIIATDGVWGVLGRGLGTKIISNGISAMLFSILWKYFERKLEGRGKKAAAKQD